MRSVYPFQVPFKEATVTPRGSAPRGSFRVATHDELNRAGRAGENQLAEHVAAQNNPVVPDQVRNEGLTPEQSAIELSIDE